MRMKIITAAVVLLVSTFCFADDYAKANKSSYGDLDIDIETDLLVQPPAKLAFREINRESALEEVKKYARQIKISEKDTGKVTTAVKNMLAKETLPASQVMVCAVEKLEECCGKNKGKKDVEKAIDEINRETARISNEIKESRMEQSKNSPKTLELFDYLVNKGVPVKVAMSVAKEAQKKNYEKKSIIRAGEEILAIKIRNREAGVSSLVLDNMATERKMQQEQIQTNQQLQKNAGTQMQNMQNSPEKMGGLQQKGKQDQETMKNNPGTGGGSGTGSGSGMPQTSGNQQNSQNQILK